MALNVFYTMVKEYAEQVISRNAAISPSTQICAILTKNHDIISGFSAVYMINESIGIIPAEYMAVVAMNNADMSRALQMITLSMDDFSVVTPNANELLIVHSLNPDNIKCNVYISPSEYIPLGGLLANSGVQLDNYSEPVEKVTDYSQEQVGSPLPDITDSPFTEANSFAKQQSMAGLFSGFGDDDNSTESVPDSSEFEKMGFITNSSPVSSPDGYVNRVSDHQRQEDFSAGISLDENNPFFDKSGTSDKSDDVVYFAEIPDDTNADTVSFGGNVSAPRTGQTISKEELMKIAKQKKKIAKTSYNVRRR